MFCLNSVLCFLSFSVLCVIEKVHSLDGEAINGGEIAKEGEYPYQVSIGSAFFSYCGGGIIDRRFVVTAAHCVTDGESKLLQKPIKVIAGISQIRTFPRTRVAVNVDKIYMPKEYMDIAPKKYTTGDIVVMRLATPLPLDSNPHLKKLELPKEGESYVQSKAVIAGYGWDEVRVTVDPISGRSDEVGKTSGNLRFADATVISQRECQMTYANPITPKHLCARVIQRVSGKPEGVCSGDSGGPLVHNGNTLIGVVSFSPMGCGEAVGAGVYTRVSSFVNFIQKAMRDSSDPEIISVTLPTN